MYLVAGTESREVISAAYESMTPRVAFPEAMANCIFRALAFFCQFSMRNAQVTGLDVHGRPVKDSLLSKVIENVESMI